MLRQSVAFEWQIGDEIEWHEHGYSDEGVGAHKRFNETQLAMGVLRSVLLALVTLCVAGSIAIPEERLAYQQADKAIRFALLQEKRLQDAGAIHSYRTLVDSAVSNQWQNRWRTAWKRGFDEETATELSLLSVAQQSDLAVATVLLQGPNPKWGEPASYREKRYYRMHGQSWLRTVPGAAYWGEQQTQETIYFQFDYYQPDQATIGLISSRLDTLYEALYQRLGMNAPQQQNKLVYALTQDQINGVQSYQNRVEFTSPSLAPVPAALTDDEYLLHEILQRLTYSAVQQAMARTRNGTEYRWNLVLWGMRSWLLQDLLSYASPWKAQQAQALQMMLDEWPQIELAMLYRSYQSGDPNETELMARYLLAETVIAYGLETYGTDRLPVLLQDFSIYSRWQDLIPQVFGVSVEAFEAGWQDYVETTYSNTNDGN